MTWAFFATEKKQKDAVDMAHQGRSLDFAFLMIRRKKPWA